MNNTFNLDKNIIKPIIKGVALTIIFNYALFLIYSIILVKTKANEEAVQPVVVTITAISILIGSSIVCAKTRKKSTIKGLIIGGTHICILFIASVFLGGEISIGVRTLLVFGIGILLGGIGGIIGANIK